MSLVKGSLSRRSNRNNRGNTSYVSKVRFDRAEKDIEFIKNTNTVVVAIVGSLGVATALGFIAMVVAAFYFFTTSVREYSSELKMNRLEKSAPSSIYFRYR